jgi:uncharacterized protein (DUF1015 family)
VTFPADQVDVMAYNRVVDLGSCTVEELLSGLARDFEVSPAAGPVEPAARHSYGVFVAGRWYLAQLRRDRAVAAGPVADLAVAVLQDRVLAGLLGIEDPRTDPRLRFVGGIRGTAELERLVDASPGHAAFSLHPTSTQELLAVADAGLLMPPKSTWFEPKLRSGLFVHPFDLV